jgi:predicted AAA+ superfamily ATPase
MDTGLLCYLRGIMNTEALERDLYSGVFFENYVISEIYKSYTNTGQAPPLYYYQDANMYKEIDLIIEQNGMVCPIEINESTDPDKKAVIKNFDALDPVTTANISVGTGNIICNINDIYPLDEDEEIWAVPHWFI